MPADLPPYLIAEEEFADWCRARGLDEDDESWRAFVMFMEENDGEPPYFTDNIKDEEPFA